ncbi:RNA polymerase subunit sigma-70 [Planococcus maritimus]|uniref:sigma-70 family RNA polymerase sigma factor n=1 Tax=Planococcus maritimus TaxID=192421 RepID=UPI00084C3335|nr:sigma-70 family RNA polymerase sigma factor [Planococcus maritimus]OED32371.1 RNA polymerase subunit sigma-70 [Planococcus maritimus]
MKSTETNFIKRLKRQKEDALEYIVDQYLPLVKGISKKILAPIESQGLIEECINDVFLTIWNQAKQFEGDTEDFRKWLCVITKYKAIDTYRKATKRLEKETATQDIEVSSPDSSERNLLIAENKNELLQLMAEMNVLDRDILVMKFFLEMTNEEIALHMGLTKAAIDNRIYRGKKRLQEKCSVKKIGGSFA